MSRHGRWDAVDGLRAVAALTVLAYHVSLARGIARSGTLAPLFAELKAGVCVFFVISGFVLYMPYARALRDGTALPDWRTFAQRRAVRILPAYWLVLSVAAFALPATGVIGANSWRYYLLAQIYNPDTLFSGLGVAWSLCVEVTFYVMLPLFAGALRRVSGRAGALRVQLAALGLLAATTTALRVAVCGSMVAGVPHEKIVLMTALPGFLDWFAIGMALAVLSSVLEKGASQLWLRPGACWFAAAALFVAAGTLQSQDLFLPMYGPATHALLGLAAGLLVLPATLPRERVARSRLLDVLAHRWIAWAGTVSFGIYLWHMLVLDAVLGAPMTPTSVPGQPLGALTLLLAVAPLAIACGAASWYGVERPLKRLIGRGGARMSASIAA